MAIIRNERTTRQEPATREEAELEEEVDYEWHPTEDEYTSPLTASQWAELLGDPSFAETDSARAVRCLYDYEGPATFQQLSIRYRGTMGRYRRWLSEAAQAAGERFGVEAPQQNQYGMDEWWPLLYKTRTTGKIGAGVFEMVLRPEVEEAYEQLAELERQAKQAENARNLQRIEQLERARQEERERHAAEQERPQTVPESADDHDAAAAAEQPVQDQPPAAEGIDQMVAEPVATAVPEVVPRREFSALRAFLDLMEAEPSAGGSRFVSAKADDAHAAVIDVAAPVDYALRYAERLRHALALMREGRPTIGAAAIARAAKDESVETLQSVLNGQSIPSFAYVDTLRDRLFVSSDRLEVADGLEDELPAFVSLYELWGVDELCLHLEQDQPTEIAYVVDDAAERRTGVIVRFSDVRSALLTRKPVASNTTRAQSLQLDAFVRMVDELDSFAREAGIARTSRQLSAAEWDALETGTIWPGTVLA